MAGITLQNDSSTVVLNERILTDLAEGDQIVIASPNPRTFRVNSGNGVTIGQRSDGGVVDVTIRVTKYGDDDVWLQNAANQATPVVLNGSVKETYSKDGEVFVASWLLENGSITTLPGDTRNTQDGNASMEYVIQFRRGVRLL